MLSIDTLKMVSFKKLTMMHMLIPGVKKVTNEVDKMKWSYKINFIEKWHYIENRRTEWTFFLEEVDKVEKQETPLLSICVLARITAIDQEESDAIFRRFTCCTHPVTVIKYITFFN